MRNAKEIFTGYNFDPSQYSQTDSAQLVLECERNFLETQRITLERWRQEDALIEHRLGWLLAGQSLLFAAYAVEVNHLLLRVMLPWLGIALCLAIFFGICAAWHAQNLLRQSGAISRLNPAIGIDAATRLGGRITAFLVPFTFACSWGWLKGGLPAVGMVGVIMFVPLLMIGIMVNRRSPE
jgi:hypothetical protein